MSTIKEASTKRVQGKLFNHLKTQPLFKDWKSSDLWKPSNKVVENNDRAITGFLDEKKYTLG